jgi:two-component system response regulator MtrA
MPIRSGGRLTLRVLVVDDDLAVRTALRLLLARDGYTPVLAENGLAAIEQIGSSAFDAVVLDWLMPGLDGLETCRRIRATSAVPILMLTARGAESDKVRVLDAGADDYVVKPFPPRELLARLRALVRRSRAIAPVDRRLVIGDMAIDAEKGEVTMGERVASVTPTEARLLLALASQAGQVRSARDLARDLGLSDVSDRDAQEIVKVNVLRLRRKIEDDPKEPRRVTTHRGFGYMLVPVGA